MKIVLYLSLLITTLFSWSFTEYDYYQLTKEQRNNLEIIHLVGIEKDLGLTLAAIGIVETRLSVKNDRNNNHVCGVMQINTKWLDRNISCKAIESNIYLSAKLAMENFLFWYHGPANKDWRKALVMYNGGYNFNPHGHEYVKRIVMVMRVLKEHFD